MKKRIKDTPVSPETYRSEFANTYRRAIEFYLGTPKEESVYVEDPELERELMRLFLDCESKIIYFLGKEGIGKTTFLKNVFGLSDNAVVFDEAKDIACISMSFRGVLLEKDANEYIINSISCVCTALEERYGFRENFYSIEGHNLFFDYIKETYCSLLENVSSVELIGKSAQDIRLLKLQRAEQKYPYAYMVSKLNFYLNYYCMAIHNIVIVIDNTEVLNKEIRGKIAKSILSFFSGLINDKYIDSAKKNLAVNLIFSMRPSTYEELVKTEEIKAYHPVTVLHKEKPVDMVKYFSLKRDTIIDKNGMQEVWDDAYEIIMTLANKFNHKYSDMISNLCNYDFESMKKIYKKILMNKVWLLRGERRRDFLNMSKTDYLFNNISVLRAIACGNNAVYRGEKSVVVPNAMLNDEFNDDSMLSLLVMSFFMRERKLIMKKRLFDYFERIFGSDPGIRESLERVVKHFLDTEILEETYNWKNPIQKSKYLYLTSRGEEIWHLFKSDSVLLEMYREDYFFDEEDDACDFTSSFQLMNTVGQYEIFIQLFLYIDLLIEKEKELHRKVKSNGTLGEYYSCFGSKIQAKRLLEGVLKSIEYSGNMYTYDIQNEITRLENKIKNIDA